MRLVRTAGKRVCILPLGSPAWVIVLSQDHLFRPGANLRGLKIASLGPDIAVRRDQLFGLVANLGELSLHVWARITLIGWGGGGLVTFCG